MSSSDDYVSEIVDFLITAEFYITSQKLGAYPQSTEPEENHPENKIKNGKEEIKKQVWQQTFKEKSKQELVTCN